MQLVQSSQIKAKLKTHDIQQYFPQITCPTLQQTADKNLLHPP